MSTLVREYLHEYFDLSHRDVVGTGRIIKMDLDYAIDSLYKKGTLNSRDLLILEYTKQQYSAVEIGRILNISSNTALRSQKKSCNEISNFLKTEYQDGKLIAQVSARLNRKLTDEEMIFCWYVINRRGKYYDKSINIFNFKIDVFGRIIANDEGDRLTDTQEETQE